MNTWRIRQIINQSLAGVVWGSVIYLFLDDVPGISDRAIVLTAVSSIAVIGFLPFHSAVIGFTVGLWSIPLPVLVFFGTTHQHQMAAGILVLVVSLNFYFWEASKQLVAGIEKNFQAEALARALRSAALRIQELAARDELTGLYNRRRGMQVFKQLLQRHNNKLPDEPGLGLLLIDIDHFKHVNDTHGHPAGDEVLRQVSRRLEHSLRQTDTVARIGGEEFMVLLPDTVADNVTRIAQELCTHVAATAVYIGDTQLQITISIGAVEVACDEVLEHALARADAGLYSAKRGGRNRVVHAAAALTQAAH
jgi:diguanylate cyclase (GGDEF)-like protein